MGRTVVIGARLVGIMVLVLSFVVARPGSAEGLNTLTFQFNICPAGGDSCQPYGATDARIMNLASGVEQWTVNDAQGWATFAGLPDGDYTFSAPAVTQQDISITCGDDVTGLIIGSQVAENGPQVALAGGQSVTCSGVMVPQSAPQPLETPTAPVTDAADENIGFISSYVSECPAGSTDMVDLNDCTTPSRPFTAYLASGTVPNVTTVEQPANQAGAAFFNVTPGPDFQLWPGVDTATETILHVSCISYLGEVDANGSPIGTDFVPSLGGAGYGLEVADGEAIDCFFSYAQDVAGGVDPSTSPAASGSVATSPAASGSAAGSPAASHAPTAADEPAASTAAAPVALPNTGTGAAERSSFDALLVTLAVASALLLLVSVALRRTSSR